MGRKAALIAATLLAACQPQPASNEAEEFSADVEPIPQIAKHAAHNELATMRIGLRNLTLSRAIRTAGEDCMVVNRSMFSGYADILDASLWSAHCERGTEWMVSIYPDGSGSVLECGATPSTNCWERFKD